MSRPRTDACSACLRRSHLIGRLAPRIAGLLDRRGATQPGLGARQPLLALEEDQLIAAVAGRGADAARRFVDEFDARRARRGLEVAGVDAVCRHGRSYPGPLLELVDPPAALYLIGGAERLAALAAGPLATVVGTRRASPYALEVAHQLGRGLSAASVAVVSGLALGVDAAAHRGALEAGDRAIAVLACGPDVPYPRTNRALYQKIAARGVILSELPPGVGAMRWSFPARNRIMAALAEITVIVEADDPSGSLITAAYAADLGREVGAVPGHVTARRAAGSNRLLRDGASLIRRPEDVLDELFGVSGLGRRGRSLDGGSWRRAEPRARRAGPSAGLESTLRRVLDGVEAAQGVDAIGAETGLSAGEVRAALGRLELMGLVTQDGLGPYQRAADP